MKKPEFRAATGKASAPRPGRRHAALALLVCLATGSGAATGAEQAANHEFLVFLSAEGYRLEPDQAPDETDHLVTGDLLYSLSSRQFRLLAEYTASNEEAELERLQLGWMPHESTWLIAGRFHQPTNFWATMHHHGQYLQTSITRPSIDEWEDDGGVMQAHQTGLMIDVTVPLGDRAGAELDFSVGTGSRLEGEGLQPFNVVDPEGTAGSAVAVRLGVLPDMLGEQKAGLVAAWNRYEVDLDQDVAPGLSEVTQEVAGAYLRWQVGPVHLTGAAYHVRNTLRPAPSAGSDRFTSGYIQGETSIGNWTLFGRWEDTANEHSSTYLRLFPDFITRRALGGVRYDFLKRHAVTLEYFRAETLPGNFDQVALQWSAVFP